MVSQGGGTHDGEKQKLKFCHLVGNLYYGIGKIAQKRVFAYFDPNNLMDAKIDLAYHVGNFPIQILKKKESEKLCFDVILTS